MSSPPIARYGVQVQTEVTSSVDAAVEMLGVLGFAVIDSGYTPPEIARIAAAFDRARTALHSKFGRDLLVSKDEHNTIRAPMALEAAFIELATNPRVLEVCHRMIGGAFILNQQNGVVNPPLSQHYSQAAFHRDLPYQHFVSSRPLAINALYCVDAFTQTNGATFVLPATHKQEAFPSDQHIRASQIQVTAPAGSYILLDCMVYHAGGVNSTERERRAVNHVYTIPLIKQQLSLPDVLGADFTNDASLRNLLDYTYTVPTSLETFYGRRPTLHSVPPVPEPKNKQGLEVRDRKA